MPKHIYKKIYRTLAQEVSDYSESQEPQIVLIRVFFDSRGFAVRQGSDSIRYFYAVCITPEPIHCNGGAECTDEHHAPEFAIDVRSIIRAETTESLRSLFEENLQRNRRWTYQGLLFEVSNNECGTRQGDINQWVSVIFLMFLSRTLRLYTKVRKVYDGGVEDFRSAEGPSYRTIGVP